MDNEFLQYESSAKSHLRSEWARGQQWNMCVLRTLEGEGATWPGIDYLKKKELISYKEEVIDEKGVLEYKLFMM